MEVLNKFMQKQKNIFDEDSYLRLLNAYHLNSNKYLISKRKTRSEEKISIKFHYYR